MDNGIENCEDSCRGLNYFERVIGAYVEGCDAGKSEWKRKIRKIKGRVCYKKDDDEEGEVGLRLFGN